MDEALAAAGLDFTVVDTDMQDSGESTPLRTEEEASPNVHVSSPLEDESMPRSKTLLTESVESKDNKSNNTAQVKTEPAVVDTSRPSMAPADTPRLVSEEPSKGEKCFGCGQGEYRAVVFACE